MKCCIDVPLLNTTIRRDTDDNTVNFNKAADPIDAQLNLVHHPKQNIIIIFQVDLGWEYILPNITGILSSTSRNEPIPLTSKFKATQTIAEVVVEYHFVWLGFNLIILSKSKTFVCD